METTTPNKIQANNKHSNKISWYRRNAVDMVNAIDDYLFENFKIELPAHWSEYKVREHDIMDFDCYQTALIDQFHNLIKMRYDFLKSSKAVYALFENKNQFKTQILACWYSKHRLDPVWNYRKSQLIRKIYREFLQKSNIHNEYHPAHLVLTVPHKDGKFMEKKFFAAEMMQLFNKLRKHRLWKKYIYAGEYGVEIKKGKNGLHIHIHSLVFQRPEYTVNEVREFILREWQALTGAKFIHYETLYFYKRKNNGTYETEIKSVFDKKLNDYVNVKQRKKFYLDRPDRPTDPTEFLNEYLHGVMECIKYHFKNDCIKNDYGDYDIDLMCDILNNTKGMRLYSRFGEFYKEPALNFNRLEVEHNEQSEAEAEEEIMGTTDKMQVYNPFTNEIALREDYRFIVGRPEWIKHRSKRESGAYEPIIYTPNVFYEIRQHEAIDLKMVLKSMFLCRLHEIMTGKSYDKLVTETLNPETKRGRQLNLKTKLR